VLPFRRNIVYIEINQGDDFGQVDIVSCSIDNDVSITDIIQTQELLLR